LTFRTLPFTDPEKRAFIDIMFTIDFTSSIDQLPIFVLNILKLCTDNHSENEITNISGYIFDNLIEYFINLDSNKQYTSNIRLCIVHILNTIELSPDLGTILLRTFKVEFLLFLVFFFIFLSNRKFRIMMYQKYFLHFVLHLYLLYQKIEQYEAK
jgi:uncharacterized RDD family membrane protein YckC